MKNIFKKIKQFKKDKAIKQNKYNEEFKEIIEDNLYNERLEAALSQLIASSPLCSPQHLSLQLEDGLTISFYSGCQVAQAQSSWK